jgi:hypothetical protein
VVRRAAGEGSGPVGAGGAARAKIAGCASGGRAIGARPPGRDSSRPMGPGPGAAGGARWVSFTEEPRVWGPLGRQSLRSSERGSCGVTLQAQAPR